MTDLSCQEMLYSPLRIPSCTCANQDDCWTASGAMVSAATAFTGALLPWLLLPCGTAVAVAVVAGAL